MKENECRDVFARLSELLDQELPEATCQELERHIENCPPCVEFVESLKKSVALHRTYRPAADAPQLSPEVKEALREAYERMLAARGSGK